MNILEDNLNDRICVFVKAGNGEYLFPAEYVLEILDLPLLDVTSSMPENICGFLHYKDTLINIADLRGMLSLESKPFEITDKILIFNRHGFIFGLLADAVSDVARIPDSETEELPFAADDELIREIYIRNKERDIPVINMNALANRVKNAHQITGQAKKPNTALNADEMKILEKRSLALKNKTEIVRIVAPDNLNRFTAFNINDEMYCVKNFYIKAFYKLSKMKLTEIPCTPDFVSGILNFGGKYVCVIDLKSFFKRGKTEITDSTVVVLLETDNFEFAFPADNIGPNIDVEQDFGETKDELIDYIRDNKVYNILNMEAIIKNERLLIK